MKIRNLRVAFFGTSHPFSLPPLRAIARRCAIVGLIESARPATPINSKLKSVADRRGWPYFRFESRGQRPTDFLKQIQPDIICVAGMIQLLKHEEFAPPKFGAINLHPSLLPKYAGPAPFFWQAHDADLNGGVTVHKIDQGIDSGEIIVQKNLSIEIGEPCEKIIARCARIGSMAMIEAIDLLVSGKAQLKGQPASQRTFARHVAPGENLIDWNDSPIERVWHFLRAAHGEHLCLPQLPQNGRGWRIGNFEREISQAPPRTIARDACGPYLSHPAGRIRLLPPTRLSKISSKLLRFVTKFR